MILSDPYGEVNVPFCQDFRYKNAVLCVVCPDSKLSTSLQPVICVRLVSGYVEKDGQRFEIGPDGQRPLFVFTGELVASLVRAYRLTQPMIAGQKRPVAETRRAPVSTERAVQNHPTTESLFG